ncbi:DUF2752 domain-containing protein [Echinicola marina]|uniref:DUF2752 domain-containing protein n=1 Tax=Echinicola marina TaxID=2859768 RepID=UPI001CF6FD7D|nr:DUF2752 domain-containing protein [Echinicola marina]UCS92585.1 DUF2752 domain-containing protein [Echinicola marina]
MKSKVDHFRRFPVELLFWCSAIVAILTIDPYSQTHLSICPLDILGIDWCPGCGLGRSMKLFATGEFLASFEMHPLGGIAWLIIAFRISELVKLFKKTSNYG